MATVIRSDPHVAAYFRIEIDGIDGGQFHRCSGLKSETEIFEYQEGGNNDYVLKLVGQSRANNIVLTEGVITDPALYKWRDEIYAGGAAKIKRRSGSIIVLGRDGKTQLARWNFHNAWPVRWELSDLDTSKGVGSCQILELAVERIVQGK
jgi:phage tail-like protein